MALAETGASINIRIPVIAGVNDGTENAEQCPAFVADLAGEKKQVNLLPYHNIAVKKYEKLGRAHDQDQLAEPERASLERVAAVFEEHGLAVAMGG